MVGNVLTQEQSQVADFSVARNGTLVYIDGGLQTSPAAVTMVWVDRKGREEAIHAPPRVYAYARLSPDGTRIALDARDEQNDIWIWDLRIGRTCSA